VACEWLKKVDVDGETWTVKLVTVPQMEKVAGVDKTAERPPMGCICYSERTIYVRRNLTEMERWATLQHELMHLALWKANESSEYKMKLDGPAEELFLNRLDSRLFRILNRNFGFGPTGGGA
jgi:hypothetical protein